MLNVKLERHIGEPHALLHEVFTYIYIYIYILITSLYVFLNSVDDLAWVDCISLEQIAFHFSELFEKSEKN